ncbi:DNA-binding anti-repressor SinI [Domibacillus sp. A3M-37]|jgi:XRE family transcriptional regulator, master regulator for biofilm formation|uniref:helix-turn-helix domain-containing protein n=1 Tax=Domibacillus TaxID=1433999 RepID=UPI0020B69C91|nr:DNA-binding anti-repressor SinI [Domibacillus sp. A3M-37]MCP3761306.1 DNA-binding anti-repressor SinI [Domibacillus sp. A3M-37]
MSIGERIRKLRMEQKLSLTELASRAAVAKSYLSSVERDLQMNPSIQFLTKIAGVLNVAVESLIVDPQKPHETVDDEWVHLAKEAMESGISKEQFREFLAFQKWKKQSDEEL